MPINRLPLAPTVTLIGFIKVDQLNDLHKVIESNFMARRRLEKSMLPPCKVIKSIYTKLAFSGRDPSASNEQRSIFVD
jgi:hypothetical protein